METREIAIKIKGIKKRYRLGVIGGRTLQEDLQSWWAKWRGREDPNTPVKKNARQNKNRFWALNGIDLTIYRGERIGIIGNNGAGKSTLLKLLSRITAPAEGEIDIWGRISSLLEIGTGFHPEMTGRENIYMNGAILGMTKAEIDAKIEDIIAFSEVEDFIDTPVKRYSSGMLVKLAFAVAANLDNEIMIMDEVLAVGDMAFQNKCLAQMRKSADAENKTILYVSHNMDTIRRLCNRCIVLSQGKIIFDGEVEKGIDLYLRQNIDENPVEIDLTGKADQKSALLSMTHLTLCDKISPVYASDESLKLRLTFTVHADVENIFFQLTFRSSTNAGIGTARSKPLSLIKAGQHAIIFSLPLKEFAKGKLYVSSGLYKQDEIGRNIALENITRAFQIEIQGVPAWNLEENGFVHFSDIIIESSRIKD